MLNSAIKRKVIDMNTLFIKIFFSIFSFCTLFYILSFANYEIKQKKNIYGGFFAFLYSLIGDMLGL